MKYLCGSLLIINLVCSCIIILYGAVSLLKTNNGIYVIWILSGALSPLVGLLAIYPIIALANIDLSVSKLNEKIDRISTDKYPSVTNHIPHHPSETSIPDRHPPQSTDPFNYINQKYNINISPDDDIQIIKAKVAEIENNEATAILKQKIASSSTMSEILTAFKIHKATRG
jgi:hypothetical protein